MFSYLLFFFVLFILKKKKLVIVTYSQLNLLDRYWAGHLQVETIHLIFILFYMICPKKA